MLVTSLVRGGAGDAGMLSSIGLLLSMGAAMFGVGALRLPGWARTRRRQMEELAGRLALLAKTPAGSLPARSDPTQGSRD
jgi:hypothetical protein